MLNVLLFQPEIPPNTGNIIRLCVNIGAKLHLIQPLGFELDDKRLRRAGLDYHEFASVRVHDSLEAARNELAPARLFGFSTKGSRSYADVEFRSDDCFLFGPETRGLPTEAIAGLNRDRRLLRIPMTAASRSLNLSNACAVVCYEAWRQLNFAV